MSVGRSGNVAYVKLPSPSFTERKVSKNIRLHDLIPGVKGPDIIFDLDKDDHVIGIEILL